MRSGADVRVRHARRREDVDPVLCKLAVRVGAEEEHAVGADHAHEIVATQDAPAPHGTLPAQGVAFHQVDQL